MSSSGEERAGVVVRYEGRVQGVGFRYTVCELAAGRPVEGWVRNEADGSVTVAADGRRADLVAFLRAIEGSRLARFIQAVRPAWGEAGGRGPGFRVVSR